MAWGLMGFGDWIWETERGRPLGTSTLRERLSLRDSRFEWCLDDDDEDLCLELREEDDECLLPP